MISRSSSYIGEPHNLYWVAPIGCDMGGQVGSPLSQAATTYLCAKDSC